MQLYNCIFCDPIYIRIFIKCSVVIFVYDVDYDERTSHTSIIRQNYVFLLDNLDVKFTGLLGQLYSQEVVSAVERDNIGAEMTFRANEKLLSVLSRKSPQQFQLFLDALDQCGQQHVRNVITERSGLSSMMLNTYMYNPFCMQVCKNQ